MIIRFKPTSNFTILPNCIAEDNDLSWKAKGLLWYLFSRPNDWNINREDLSNRSKDGVSSIRSGMKELVEAGYAKLDTLWSEDGSQIAGKQWVLTYMKHKFDEPENSTSPIVLKPNGRQQTQSQGDLLLSTECTKDSCVQSTDVLKAQKDAEFEPKASKPGQNAKGKCPDIAQAVEYGAVIGLIKLECEKFFDYYNANGWRVGKVPMKDWKAAMRNWLRNFKERNGSGPAGHGSDEKEREEEEFNRQAAALQADRLRYQAWRKAELAKNNPHD